MCKVVIRRLLVKGKRNLKKTEAQRSYAHAAFNNKTEGEPFLAAALGPLACPSRSAWLRKCLNLT